MKIYIASSWKNKHAVEMMTDMLEKQGHTVLSFVRNAGKSETFNNNLDEWIASEDGKKKFEYDTDSVRSCTLVIYIGPSGEDAAAECGMAWSCGIPIVGLYAKGTNLGLMRRMMEHWCNGYIEVLEKVKEYDKEFKRLRRIFAEGEEHA
jgi:hypothetical protein